MSIFDHPVLNGLGGLSHGSFFRVSDNVDTSRPPGAPPPPPPPQRKNDNTTSDNSVGTLSTTFQKIVTGEEFLYSPNLTWFLMAVLVWLYFPYNLDPFDDDDYNTNSMTTTPRDEIIQMFWNRFLLNHVVFLGYISFWHIVLYIYPKMCTRPYVPNRRYNVAKVIHNFFYTWLGIVQWTVTEVAFIYCYKTGRLIHHNDPETSSTDRTFTMKYTVAAVVLSVLLPSWRDVHFYFCHRMIHLRFVYKYIHSLHHRNTDIEPFSGLCMHPCEHLYYYTCYALVLVLSSPSTLATAIIPNFVSSTAPFLLFWTGLHVVISPAASHSGYEDHFSADLAHYLHHRYCECNYAAGINFDSYFGTYEACLRKTTPESTNETTTTTTTTATQAKSESASSISGTTPSTSASAAPLDPKATLWGWMPEHPLYQCCYLLTYAVVIADAMQGRQSRIIPPILASVVLSFCPVIWALCLSVVRNRASSSSSSWRKLILSPFDKDSPGSLTLHLGLGVVLGVLPATVLFYLVLS